MISEAEQEVVIEVISGPEGSCLAIGKADGTGLTRIAGPKPWGGGRVLHSWRVPVSEILRSLADSPSGERVTR